MAEAVYFKTSSRISVRNSDWRNHMTMKFLRNFATVCFSAKSTFYVGFFIRKVDSNSSSLNSDQNSAQIAAVFDKNVHHK